MGGQARFSLGSVVQKLVLIAHRGRVKLNPSYGNAQDPITPK
jgi:hypothetical protein